MYKLIRLTSVLCAILFVYSVALAQRPTVSSRAEAKGYIDNNPKQLQGYNLGQSLDLTGMHLVNVNISNTEGFATNFGGANLQGANLKNSQLTYPFFNKANMAGVNASKAYWQMPILLNVNLIGANFDRAQAYDAQGPVEARGISFEKGSLTGNLSDSNFSAGKFSNTWLGNATFVNVSFSGANMTNATLRGSNLTDVLFNYTVLQNADLSGTNLTNANFTKADISGVNFSGATISNTANPDGVRCNDLACLTAGPDSSLIQQVRAKADGHHNHEAAARLRKVLAGMIGEPNGYSSSECRKTAKRYSVAKAWEPWCAVIERRERG